MQVERRRTSRKTFADVLMDGGHAGILHWSVLIPARTTNEHDPLWLLNLVEELVSRLADALQPLDRVVTQSCCADVYFFRITASASTPTGLAP